MTQPVTASLHDTITFFHDQKSFPGYDDIPKTTLGANHEPLPQLDEAAKKALAEKHSAAKDTFQASQSPRIINPESAESVKSAPTVEAKKGLAKASEAIKEAAGKLGKTIGKHKVAAGIIGAVAVAGAAFGIYKGVQAHNNKVQAHQS